MQRFLDAVSRLFSRKPTPQAGWGTREWQAAGPVIRQRAFFSARVGSVRVLSAFRSMMLDWMDETLEEVETPDGRFVTAYKEQGMAKFREKAQSILIKEGLAAPDDYGKTGAKEIASLDRLKLIFNTNVEAANTLARYQQQVQNQQTLNAWPAARFVRRPGATIKRRRHVEAEGEVHRWDDWAFWLFQNADDIGGFGVPWGPWGFNSYMTQQPVRRSEAEKLGLVRKGEILKPLDLTPWGITRPADLVRSGAEADLSNEPDEISRQARQEIADRLGPGAFDKDGKITLDTYKRFIKP